MSTRRGAGFAILSLIVVAVALPAPPALARDTEASTSCLACHGDADFFDGEDLAIVEDFAGDVHAELGLSCHDCHGGNPTLEVAEDIDLSMDTEFAEGPYLGAPERPQVAAFCGRCHSDPAYMKRFRPDPVVGQEAEYRTSQHGQAQAAGRAGAATCTDCHDIHGIRRVADSESPVYPTRVADTCGSCHADAERMAGVVLPDGRALPIDQLARWRQSVHAAALFDKGDFSAPTCNDCHGNHGAAPPGIDSIALVCGQCHGREARLFRASAKHEGYEEHNEMLADAGDDGCAACHEAPEPMVGLPVRSFTECATCHGNHAVIRPTIAMLSPLPATPCAICHEGAGPMAGEVPEPEAVARHYGETRDRLLASSSAEGLADEALFDHLVDRARELPDHTAGGNGDDGPPALREEFERLFEKFRIGKTAYTFEDEGGGSHTVEVVRCNHCHGPEPLAADAPLGFEVARDALERMRQLTALTGRAERIVLAARRGGVETRDALGAIDGAVDAQIGLEVLVHGFDAGDDAAFAEKHAEGLDSARAALTAGRAALDELAFRRRGLATPLIFLAAVAVGLALKIRELSQPQRPR